MNVVNAQESMNLGNLMQSNLSWELTKPEANLKNIFASPYPTLFYPYGSVGRKLIFFN